MSRHAVLAAVDVVLALLLAALVLIVSPGIAVTGMIAVFVLVVCGLSIMIGRRRRRRPRRLTPRRGPFAGGRRSSRR